jgi:hypothetical protein
MTWKVFQNERGAGLFAAAIDKRLGYPKTHAAGEYRRGSGRHAATPPHTETHSTILALADGTYAVEVDDIVSGLSVADVDVDVGAGQERVTIDVAGAVTTVDRDTATLVAPRGGLTLEGT